MARALRDQARVLFSPGASDAARPCFAAPLEIVVPYPADDDDGEPLARVLSELAPPGDSAVFVKLAPTSGERYYEAKNTGFLQATGDLVLFLDSDVIPEDGWLQSMLAAFSDPNVGVVAGDAYVDTSTLLGKAFALFWFFPLRREDGPVVPANTFFANNVGFRREILAAHPYPAIEGATRGACTALARELLEAGVAIHRQPAARVSHPPPNGLRHFVVRALAQGRDRAVLGRRAQAAGSPGRPSRRLREPVREVRGACGSILRNGGMVGLSRTATPIALGVAVLYYTIVVAGQAATKAFPRFMQDRFRV